MVRTPPLHAAYRSATEHTTSCVFAAWWCRSVGMSWTVELRSTDEAALTGPAVEWICSGVPTQQAAPERQTTDLLRERGLLLFPVDPVESAPRARSRQLIGYVTRDPEILRVARLLAHGSDNGTADESLVHPMVLAAQWVQAGYSADAAASWVAAGVTSPESDT